MNIQLIAESFPEDEYYHHGSFAQNLRCEDITVYKLFKNYFFMMKSSLKW